MKQPGQSRRRAFSGVQPSGGLHLGNYLGAIRNWVLHQDDFDNVFCVVDLHRVTVPHDPATQRTATRDVAAWYLAAGLDPGRCILFVQSHVSAHSELAWLLNCVTPMGWVGRMTQFKEKSGAARESVSVGLFDYPVLMAADILLYDAHVVPVGDDQKQHVELCRDIAQAFNRRFGPVLVVPEPLIREVGARIMSLDDPTSKMSKSNPNPRSRIELGDSPKTIRKKFARATTDSLTEVRFDPERPGITNLLGIFRTLTGWSEAQIEAHFAGKLYGHLKKEVADATIQALEPLQRRHDELMSDLTWLESVLASGAERARTIARKTLARVHEAMGLG